MRIRPLFRWYDMYIGFYWDRKARSLYCIFLGLGIVLDFDPSLAINQRRIDLIHKKYTDEGLTKAETTELDFLQNEFFQALEDLHPRNNDQLEATLDKIEARLKQRRQAKE